MVLLCGLNYRVAVFCFEMALIMVWDLYPMTAGLISLKFPCRMQVTIIDEL